MYSQILFYFGFGIYIYFYFLNLFSIFNFLWLCHESWRILVLQPGIEPRPLAMKLWNPNQWTAREFPQMFVLSIHLMEDHVYITLHIKKWPMQSDKLYVLLRQSLVPYTIKYMSISLQFSHSVMSHSATPWTAARQAFLSITNSWSPPKPMSYVGIYMCVYIMYIYINTLIFFEEKILIHL